MCKKIAPIRNIDARNSSPEDQVKPKADWCTVDYPKTEQTTLLLFFAFLVFTAKKTNPFVCFLGESKARKSADGFI